ncbi:hypothetical protein OIV83_006383 [Microbotryomycetes sp. JL201]|nr:hypothetical protein OIV83_006383 [Microbotryomycetes sp. JL201]
MARKHVVVQLANRATADVIRSKLQTSLGSPPSASSSGELVIQTQASRQALTLATVVLAFDADADARSVLVQVFTTKTLPLELREWIWSLFLSNMQELYEASHDGFDPEAKRRELFEPTSRFFVARSHSNKGDQESSLLGYVIYRYDTEETSGTEDADVVYCYELQLEERSRRQGVGTLLMDLLFQTAKDFRMDKVMLTVFKSNKNAVAFYERTGHATDELDPSCFGRHDADYRIMSRACSK